MQLRAFSPTLCALALLAPLAHAVNLERSTITELVKDVTIINPTTKSQKAAKLNDVFVTPNVMRTGPDSRVEMIAPDQTVTRVGANTLFSFEPDKREINLQRGSVLFNSPSGKGGGTIKTAAATAAVLGTTIIVVTTPNGGFKVLLVEGHGRVTSPNGQSRLLGPGQMTFILPGQNLGPVYNYQIREQAGSSKLIGGFRKELPAFAKIGAAIDHQQRDIAKGQLIPTGLLAGTKPGEAYKLDPAGPEQRFGPPPANGGPRPDPRFAPGVGPNGQFSPNTPIDPGISAARFAHALSTNLIAASPLLAAEYLFALDDPEAILRGADPTFINPSGIMYLANNIILNAAGADLRLPPASEVRLIAINNIQIAQSIMFLTAPGQTLSLIAGGTVSNQPGTLVTTHTPLTQLAAFGSTFTFNRTQLNNPANFSPGHPLQLTDFELTNNGGNMQVFSHDLLMSNAGFYANGALTIKSAGSIFLDHNVTTTLGSSGVLAGTNPGVPLNPTGSFSPRGTGFESGMPLTMTAAGNINAYYADFVSPNTTLSAAGNMIMDTVRFSSVNFNPNQGNINLHAGNAMQIINSGFQLANINMSANTIILKDVRFASGSHISMKCPTGLLNTNINTISSPSQILPGQVNFVTGNTYGGITITSSDISAVNNSPLTPSRPFQIHK